MVEIITLHPSCQGLHEFTDEVALRVKRWGEPIGLCTLFIRHTSASLLIQENADPTARQDLERWLARLVVEGDPLYRHNDEGPDDMPAHIRAALTASHLSIPILHGQLLLGTWQGIYLWEHRRHPSPRQVAIHLGE
jgi:secondary thiamine-phosphate synthase enzyme